MVDGPRLGSVESPSLAAAGSHFMKTHSAFTLVAIVFTSATAFAQGHGGHSRSSNVPAPDQEMTFTDELVQGQLVRPDMSTVRGNRRTHGISLLRVRQHFVQEMLQTVENF